MLLLALKNKARVRLFSRLCVGMALGLAPCFSSVAQVAFFTDETAWQNAVGASLVRSFDTTAPNVLLASEVNSTPSDDDELGPTLTFTAGNTGLCGDFTLSTLEAGAEWVFEDEFFGFPSFSSDTLSVGSVNSDRDDDFSLTFNSDYYAVGYFLDENAANTGDSLQISGVSGVIDTIPGAAIPGNSTGLVFIGVIADEIITSVTFDSSTFSFDDIALKHVRLVCANEDSDADDLSNLAERQAGTNPEQNDSDGDALSDGDEISLHGTDPLDADSDEDGINDGSEVTVHSTDPLDDDTDNDGLLDGFEVVNGFDPLGTDESMLDGDTDGLTNLQEQANNTNPGSSDTDSDGLDDGDEINIHNTNPSIADTDGDAFSDGAEISIGTDPNNALESPFEQIIAASDGQGGDEFGFRVAMDGDIAVIGARFEDSAAFNAGAAYVFSRVNGSWTEQQKLMASDAEASDNFGISVAISGDTIVIGADSEDAAAFDAGAAYVFVLQNGVWTEQQKLLASDAQSSDLFGFSVDIDGETLVVGARFEDAGGNAAGAAYVFTRLSGVWSEQQKLLSSDAAASDDFGHSTAIAGSTIAIGARFEDAADNAGAGSAYIFEQANGIWTEQQKLVASDVQPGDQFGGSIALLGDQLLIGADQRDAGAVYSYTRANGIWNETQKLIADDGAVADRFGTSVALSGDRAAVGAFFEDAGGSNAGAAYVFIRENGVWIEHRKFVASDAQGGENFGVSVALFDDAVVAGAHLNDRLGGNSGSTYFYDLDIDNDGRLNEFEITIGLDPLVAEFCGDGVPEPILDEQCDDGNMISGDGCSNVCVAEICGNGLLQPAIGEVCDDGNTSDFDGCSAMCLRESSVSILGTAAGGNVEYSIGGETVSIATSNGDSSAQIATALATAINANSNLAASGIIAGTNGSFLIHGNEPSNFEGSDSGVALGTTLKPLVDNVSLIPRLLDFERLSSGDLVASSDTLEGVTFSYLTTPATAEVTNSFDVVSPANGLGLDVQDNAFLDGDAITFDLPMPLLSFGLYVVTSDPATAGEILLTTNFGTTSNDASPIAIAADGGYIYFISQIANSTFNQVTLDFADDGEINFLFNIDDLVAEVPIVSTRGYQGVAVGGFVVGVTINGIVIDITTVEGLTAEQIAQALANAINNNALLQSLGIAAVADGSQLLANGDIEMETNNDPGLGGGVREERIPFIKPIGLILLALILGCAASRRKSINWER